MTSEIISPYRTCLDKPPIIQTLRISQLNPPRPTYYTEAHPFHLRSHRWSCKCLLGSNRVRYHKLVEAAGRQGKVWSGHLRQVGVGWARVHILATLRSRLAKECLVHPRLLRLLRRPGYCREKRALLLKGECCLLFIRQHNFCFKLW